MDAPQFVLPCLNARLELYSDCLIIYPVGSLAQMFGITGQTILFKDIKAVRLINSGPRISGIFVITHEDAQKKATYVTFAHEYAREAEAVYEALDELITRRDVLAMIRDSEHS